MTQAPTRLDCQHCGACCFSGAERYVRVSGNDYARLGDFAEQFTLFIGNQAFMRMEQNRCSALEFNAETGRFACGVYERRPEACRDLLNDSPACAAERVAKAELVLVTLRGRRQR
jgi:Fe-S-cluster containining protein